MKKTITGADEDLRLSVAIRHGDKQALGMLYDKYAPALMGFISRVVPAPSIAEEILQTTFMHAWHHVGSFNASGSSLFTWLMNTARQLAIDKGRLGQVQNLSQSNLVYEHANSNGAGTIIPEPVQNMIFNRVYYKGESCTKIAGELGIPVEEIKKQIRLVIKTMASEIVL